MTNWLSYPNTKTQCRSRWEFLNPFYVIVHADEALFDCDLYEPRFSKVLKEIDFTRNFEDSVELSSRRNPNIAVKLDIPKDRPVLVCGFFRESCVRYQRDALREAGYDAHVCLEGSF